MRSICGSVSFQSEPAFNHVYFKKPAIGIGIDPADALHLACAESAGAVLLTTDDTVIKIFNRNSNQIPSGVNNPVQWLMEVNNHGGKDIE
jgi:hypothetical protein